MDATRCPQCNKRMKVVATADGRTGFECVKCDQIDPIKTEALKWAASTSVAPTSQPEATRGS